MTEHIWRQCESADGSVFWEYREETSAEQKVRMGLPDPLAGQFFAFWN